MTTDTSERARLRPVHTRTTVLGLLLVAGALVLVLAAEITTGNPEASTFFVPPAVIISIIAGLAWRFGTWSKVLAAVGGLLVFVALAEIFVPAIGAPADFVRFVGAAMLVAGSLLAVVGGIAAVVKRRDRRAEATFLEQQVRAIVLAGLGAMAVFSGVVALTGEPAIDAETRAAATEVVVHNYEFGDGTVEIPAGEPVTLIVDNRDWTRHTFTIVQLGVDVELRPGSESLVELPAVEPGTYRINCEPHSGHEARLITR